MSDVIVPTPHGDVPGHWVAPKDYKAAIIVIHEVWGLNGHTRDIAERIADLGYAVFAPDLIGHTGVPAKIGPEILGRIQNPETRDEAQKEMREAMAPIQSPEFGTETGEKLQAIADWLRTEQGAEQVGITGFCFGGTYTWALAVRDPQLAVGVVFYGHAPSDEELAKVQAPMYGFYGQDDTALVDDLPRIEAAIKAAGQTTFEYQVYTEAGHAFMNDTNERMYRPGPAKDAFERLTTILAKHLG